MQRQTTVSANAPVAEALAASSLLDSFILRAQRANLSSKDKRMGTSLGKYESLLRTLPNLRQLRPLSFPGDYATSIANEAVLCTLAEYMRSLPNRSADTPVKGSGIADYVSAVKCLAEEHFSTPVLCSGGGLTLRRGLMNMRREDGASGQRDLSAPLFNSHIVQLAQAPAALSTAPLGVGLPHGGLSFNAHYTASCAAVRLAGLITSHTAPPPAVSRGPISFGTILPRATPPQ